MASPTQWGHEFEQALGDGEGQGSLVCCSPWAREESDTAEQPNDNNKPLREPSAMCRGVTLTSGDQEPPLRVGPPPADSMNMSQAGVGSGVGLDSPQEMDLEHGPVPAACVGWRSISCTLGSTSLN